MLNITHFWSMTKCNNLQMNHDINCVSCIIWIIIFGIKLSNQHCFILTLSGAINPIWFNHGTFWYILFRWFHHVFNLFYCINDLNIVIVGQQRIWKLERETNVKIFDLNIENDFSFNLHFVWRRWTAARIPKWGSPLPASWQSRKINPRLDMRNVCPPCSYLPPPEQPI